MRRQLFPIIISSAVLLLALLVKQLYFPKLSGQAAYFFLSIFWICGFLIALLLLNMLWHFFNDTKASETKENKVARPNRRKSFRIIYPSYIRPKLVIEITDEQPRRDLEFQIVDLSQEGACFLDDGSLGPVERFNGHIRFVHGDSIRVAGKVVYKKKNHISAQFNRAIEWSTLRDEQSRVMAEMKAGKSS